MSAEKIIKPNLKSMPEYIEGLKQKIKDEGIDLKTALRLSKEEQKTLYEFYREVLGV